VPSRRATYQFGLRIGPTCYLDVYELPDRGSVRRLTTLKMPGAVEMHDVFATDRYLVFAVTPYYSSALGLLAKGSFVESLVRRAGEGTRFLIVPIDEPSRVIEIETEPFFVWHAVNAFEDAGRLVLDLIRYDDFQDHAAWIVETTAGRPRAGHGSTLVRYTLDPIARTARWATMHDRPGEFPVVTPTRWSSHHRFAWMSAWDRATDGQGWFDRIARIDLERDQRVDFDPGPRTIVGEPTLVPRSDREDDTWMLALCLDLDRGSYLGVWDGASAGGEPIARAWFADPLPPGLHGTWQPATDGQSEA
jgi:all-trans-8'-apo-beta-carotenal 15,15'-oxygenase